jgi:hypothetical protein
LEKDLQSQVLVGDFGGWCIHRSSRQREKAIEMLQFFRAVSALTVSMDLIDCFWRKADIELKGGARRRLVESATFGVDGINGG